MAGRGPQSFQKRQKEQKRKEKQQEKMELKRQRKLAKQAGHDTETTPMEEETSISGIDVLLTDQ